MNHDHMSTGHLGEAETMGRKLRQYFWPGMNNEIKTHVNLFLNKSVRLRKGAASSLATSLGINLHSNSI